MRKRILLVISVLLVLGMAIAAVAYQRTTLTTKSAMECCCCSGDSCPMKSKAAKGGESASCCDGDCCCKGEGSCPMKKNAGSVGTTDPSVAPAAAEGKKEGCCSCCTGDKGKATSSV